jgi:hypothetical protein
MLNSSLKYAPNPESREKVKMVIKLFQDTFGALAIKDRVLDVMVRVTAFLENIRIQKNGVIMRQPRRLRTRYGKRSLVLDELPNPKINEIENALMDMRKAV